MIQVGNGINLEDLIHSGIYGLVAGLLQVSLQMKANASANLNQIILGQTIRLLDVRKKHCSYYKSDIAEMKDNWALIESRLDSSSRV